MKNKILVVILILLSFSLTSCGENKNKVNNKKTNETKVDKKENLKNDSVKIAIWWEANNKKSSFKETSNIINTAKKWKKFNEKETEVKVKWR